MKTTSLHGLNSQVDVLLDYLVCLSTLDQEARYLPDLSLHHVNSCLVSN